MDSSIKPYVLFFTISIISPQITLSHFLSNLLLNIYNPNTVFHFPFLSAGSLITQSQFLITSSAPGIFLKRIYFPPILCLCKHIVLSGFWPWHLWHWDLSVTDAIRIVPCFALSQSASYKFYILGITDFLLSYTHVFYHIHSNCAKQP